MFINVRQKTEKARNSMAQRYNSSSSVCTFNIGDLVSLHIDAKYRKSTTPAKLFCKVSADMHIDYDAALLIVQSLKARQYGDLVSRTKLFIKDAQQLYIASNS